MKGHRGHEVGPETKQLPRVTLLSLSNPGGRVKLRNRRLDSSEMSLWEVLRMNGVNLVHQRVRAFQEERMCVHKLAGARISVGLGVEREVF